MQNSGHDKHVTFCLDNSVWPDNVYGTLSININLHSSSSQ